MAVSMNSLLAFETNSTLQARYHHVSRSSVQASTRKVTRFKSYWDMFGSGMHIKGKKGLCFSLADSNSLATNDKGPKRLECSSPDEQQPALDPSSVDSVGGITRPQTSRDGGAAPQTSGTSNGSMGSVVIKEEGRPNLQSTPKRSPLTARERLKAARVRNRYAEAKPTKSDMGSKVLDALRESDGGKKRSGLPEAPTNLFDDSQRGLPKQGWTFQFPGGSDLFVIVFSFVFISTIMFATTYIVWKVGAIHFNEY